MKGAAGASVGRGAGPRGLALAAGATLLAAACRLSDPVFAFRSIEAAEPAFDDRSLLFGTIEVDAWGSGDPDVVVLRRRPGDEPSTWKASRTDLFRVFRRRELKDGHFVMQVPPGIYELSSIVTSGWGQPRVWRMAEDGDRPRVVVTRPGVYDLGTLRVTRAARSYEFTVAQIEGRDGPRDRVLRDAIAGTSWERLLDDDDDDDDAR